MRVERVLKKALSVALCSALLGGTAVMLPAVSSEVSVTADAAQVYGDYEYEISDNKVTITKYIGSLGEAVIPDSISGKPVTAIGESAFEDCKWLKKVTIPDSVTTIDRYAFCDCEKLLSVTFGKNVKSIGEGAFRACYDLTSITLPDSLTSIGESAFECCISLESANIPDSVTSIGKMAFDYCIGMKSVKISSSVTSIGIGVFWDCSALTSVTIPDGVTSIGESAFLHCINLTSVKIPDSVTSIGELAFSTCLKLKSIDIPDSVTTIDDDAFSYCYELESVKIGNGVTSIGKKAFRFCNALKSISIPDSVTSIGEEAFGYCWDDELKKDYKADWFTIYGKRDSAAEKYAIDNEFEFVETYLPLKNISSISSDSINLNETVSLTAKAQDGTKPYTYAFMYKAPGAASWKVIGTKFGTSDTESFKPAKAGKYEILISVKDSGGKTEAKKFTLDVKAKLVNKSSVSGTDVPCGTKITITGAAEGGEGAYLYTYQIKKPGKTAWTTLGDKYGTAASKVFTAKLSGTYEVRVLVKDGTGTVKSFTATVNSTGTLLTNKSTISTAKAKVGDKVTLSAVPDGGTEPYRFTYEYKKPGSASWKTIGKRGAAYQSVSFTAETAGTYEARVYIQDASDYVTVKTFKVTVS